MEAPSPHFRFFQMLSFISLFKRCNYYKIGTYVFLETECNAANHEGLEIQTL